MIKIETDLETLAKPIIDKCLKNSLSQILTKYYDNYDDYAVLTEVDENYYWIEINSSFESHDSGYFDSKKDALIYAIKNDWPLYICDGNFIFNSIKEKLKESEQKGEKCQQEKKS